MSTRYCPHCGRYVNEQRFDWLLLIVLLLCFLVPGVIYGLYCLMKKSKCPICETELHRGESPLDYS